MIALQTDTMTENLKNILTQTLNTSLTGQVLVDVMRLDLLHPVVSGNKWFKLKDYLAEAIQQQKSILATFGGAYSNHIVASAFAAREAGMRSIGYIRGEPGKQVSDTLLTARSFGMEIRYLDRVSFRNPEKVIQENKHPAIYWVREGGYGITGANGAATILQHASLLQYTDIVCAVGTGTMLAGLIKSALPHQRLTGILVVNNANSIREEINRLLTPEETLKPYSLIPDYTFGGYAKHTKSLLENMCDLWFAEHIPSDFVYTGKLFFAVKDLVSKGYFTKKSRVLVIHSGGLQGNGSLPENTLPF